MPQPSISVKKYPSSIKLENDISLTLKEANKGIVLFLHPPFFGIVSDFSSFSSTRVLYPKTSRKANPSI